MIRIRDVMRSLEAGNWLSDRWSERRALYQVHTGGIETRARWAVRMCVCVCVLMLSPVVLFYSSAVGHGSSLPS